MVRLSLVRPRLAIGKARASELLVDTFTRADSAVTLGNAESGQAWVPVTGTWGVTGGTAYSATTSVNLALVNVNARDIEMQAVLARAASNTGVVFRTDVTGSTGYRVRADGTNIYLEAVYNAGTVLTQTALTWGTRTLKVTASGPSIQVYADGVLRLTFTEVSAQTGTYVGLWKNSAATTTQTYDNLRVSSA